MRAPAHVGYLLHSWLRKGKKCIWVDYRYSVNVSSKCIGWGKDWGKPNRDPAYRHLIRLWFTHGVGRSMGILYGSGASFACTCVRGTLRGYCVVLYCFEVVLVFYLKDIPHTTQQLAYKSCLCDKARYNITTNPLVNVIARHTNSIQNRLQQTTEATHTLLTKNM